MSLPTPPPLPPRLTARFIEEAVTVQVRLFQQEKERAAATRKYYKEHLYQVGLIRDTALKQT